MPKSAGKNMFVMRFEYSAKERDSATMNKYFMMLSRCDVFSRQQMIIFRESPVISPARMEVDVRHAPIQKASVGNAHELHHRVQVTGNVSARWQQLSLMDRWPEAAGSSRQCPYSPHCPDG